jgi:D-amino-acid dehydrogenase
VREAESMNAERGEVTVIGAGIVGIACAINLQRLGYTVTVIDREGAAGEGCSFGNAGMMAPCALVPVNIPGLLWKAPKMLLDPLAPLFLRWRYLPRMLPWLVSYLYNSRATKVEQVCDALAPLVSGALEEHQRLAAGTGAESWIQPSPYLYLYTDRAAMMADDYAWSLRRARGIKSRVLEGAALHEFEPAISDDYQCALILEEGHGYARDPSQLVKALTEGFLRDGGRFHQGEVSDVQRSDTRIEALCVDGDYLPVERLVVAAGAWSGKLAAQLGDSVPLEAERGYHITVKNPGVMPQYPIMYTAGKLVATPMSSGLRFAGLVEFGGLESEPDYRCARTLITHARRLFPEIDPSDFSEWMGHRPALPDSLPVIGPASAMTNAWYAFGHQHIGMMSGPKTGRALAELIAGQTPDIDLSPYSVHRFSP